MNIILEEIKTRLSVFKNMYDWIRIVDPLKKEVLISNNSGTKVSNEKCYTFWENNTFCENCISMRAYIELDTIFKIEHCCDKIMLIIATPTTIDGITYVVELIKEIDSNAETPNDYLINDQMNELIFEINEKAIKDEMTGVYNRRYINERLLIDLNDHYLKNQSLSIIMADIDYFKRINDNNGHVYGDQVLKDFVPIILNNIRDKNDWVGRYGGEEFIIVLSNTDLNEAYLIAERIRKDIETNIFQYGDKSIKITTSFGVSDFKGFNIGIEEAISRVDKNLYQAKQNGRNRTCRDNQII